MSPFWKGFGVGLLVVGVAVLFMQRRTEYVSHQFQQSIDSILKYRVRDSLQLAATQDTLRKAQAQAEASVVTATAHVHAAVVIATTNPIPKPDSTCRDSVRFWNDSATKAQRAFGEMKLGADTALQALHRAVEAIGRANMTISNLGSDKSRLTQAVDSLNNSLHRATRPLSLFGTCKLMCVRPFVGVGMNLDRKIRPVVGLGVSINLPWGG